MATNKEFGASKILFSPINAIVLQAGEDTKLHFLQVHLIRWLSH
jgi:hypothetical protein